MNEKLRAFIVQHLNDDIHQLAMDAKKYPEINISEALSQINGRKKVCNKLPIFHQNENILYPIQLSLEQSSSQITATYKASLCNGYRLVDLTGGFGVDSYFLAENFDEVIYVEKNEELCRIATHNFSALKRTNIMVVNSMSESFLMHYLDKADWMYIDPARRDNSGKKVVKLADCEPDVTVLLESIFEKSDNLMVKLSPMLDIHAIIDQLHGIAAVHIIAVDNECKELLLILNKKTAATIQIKTINFQKSQVQNFEYYLQEEQQASCQHAQELENYRFLYEPNAAIMKAGAFKLIGQHFRLDKLQVNTHLYVSNELHIEFPGRVFAIKKIWEKEKWKANALSLKKANVATRNFPISVDEIRKKLKLADGGETYLFACTLSDNKKVIIETIKA